MTSLSEAMLTELAPEVSVSTSATLPVGAAPNPPTVSHPASAKRRRRDGEGRMRMPESLAIICIAFRPRRAKN